MPLLLYCNCNTAAQTYICAAKEEHKWAPPPPKLVGIFRAYLSLSVLLLLGSFWRFTLESLMMMTIGVMKLISKIIESTLTSGFFSSEAITNDGRAESIVTCNLRGTVVFFHPIARIGHAL